jgi:hypothetical protein
MMGLAECATPFALAVGDGLRGTAERLALPPAASSCQTIAAMTHSHPHQLLADCLASARLARSGWPTAPKRGPLALGL